MLQGTQALVSTRDALATPIFLWIVFKKLDYPESKEIAAAEEDNPFTHLQDKIDVLFYVKHDFCEENINAALLIDVLQTRLSCFSCTTPKYLHWNCSRTSRDWRHSWLEFSSWWWWRWRWASGTSWEKWHVTYNSRLVEVLHISKQIECHSVVWKHRRNNTNCRFEQKKNKSKILLM